MEREREREIGTKDVMYIPISTIVTTITTTATTLTKGYKVTLYSD